jgi:Eukaryotic aspartyl protease
MPPIVANLRVQDCAKKLGLAWFISLFLSLALHQVVAQERIPAPISIPPSTNWYCIPHLSCDGEVHVLTKYRDGNDGPWSSFTIQVGSPAQAVRVLPSSSGSSLWAVVDEGCSTQDPAGCPESRGGIFNPNSSSTWAEEGLYQLPLAAEIPFGYSGNGRFGFDSVVMSYGGGEGATVNNSVVAGIATKDFYIGTIGLTPHGTNFTDFNDPKPSILKLLRDSGKIASRSWAYTAGAFYTPKKTFGSLLFGGYDTSRFVPNNLTIGLGQDISRDILVGVQSISIGEVDLLDQGIIAYIDSTIPHIWLPIQTCENFERAFGLAWDPDLELYLVNDTLHSNLLADNPTIKFTIGSSVNGGETVEIELPYGAFDLEAREPLTRNGTSRYFPLRRAQNETQYALGRTFLQQAYLIVDYDRNNFSVSQAVFPDTGIAEHRIPILDPSSLNETANSASSAPSRGDGKLSTAAIAGIVIGVIVAILIAAAATILYFQRRKLRLRRQFEEEAKATEQQQPFEKSELDAKDPEVKSPTELSSEVEKAELAGSTQHVRELSGKDARVEAGGDETLSQEMPGSGVYTAELESPGPGGQRIYHELP